MNAKSILPQLKGVTQSGSGWTARCPAHDDHRASLSIADGDRGLVLHCHAGCSIDAITKAIGLKPADLFNGKPESNGKPQIIATYDYQDESGKLLFQVCRFEPKDFRQRAPAGNGGWSWSIKGIRRVPFHLPELLAAIKDSRPIYVAEGEKDVLALEKAGFAATCNPGGAGKWLSEFGRHLSGAQIIVVADKDEPGRKHARDVADKLRDVAAEVRVIELPDIAGRAVKDAADYFAAGGQAADLDALSQVSTATPEPWVAMVEDGADLQARELPPVVEIVNGIVAEFSKLSIVSSAKCYKTWVTIHLAMAISHEADFLGRTTTRRRVLYVNLELKPETFTRRLQAIAKRLGISIDRQWFSHLSLRGRMAGLSVHEVVSRIIAVARARGATVIVIDPVFKLNVEGEENSSRDQTVFFNQLDRITTEGRATLILNDHSGKGNQSEKDPLDVIRGSSAKGGDLDAAMVLRKHEVDECFRVDLVHRELPPVEPFVIGWRFPVMELRPDLSADAMKKVKAGRRKEYDLNELVSAIPDATAGNPVSISAWAEAAGIKRQTLTDYLPGLRAKGWIATSGEGSAARQYLTDAGRKAARQHLAGGQECT